MKNIPPKQKAAELVNGYMKVFKTMPISKEKAIKMSIAYCDSKKDSKKWEYFEMVKHELINP